jgi:hypothetical protein
MQTLKQVWYVSGEVNQAMEWPTLFDSKQAAESYAALIFPDETRQQQYQRIFFRTVEGAES